MFMEQIRENSIVGLKDIVAEKTLAVKGFYTEGENERETQPKFNDEQTGFVQFHITTIRECSNFEYGSNSPDSYLFIYLRQI